MVIAIILCAPALTAIMLLGLFKLERAVNDQTYL